MTDAYIAFTGRGTYPHVAHLKEFEQRRNKQPPPAWLQRVSTPLICREWARDLEDHPDCNFKNYILIGIAHGFHVGFDYQHHQCRSVASNMHSAVMHAGVVKEYLD